MNKTCTDTSQRKIHEWSISPQIKYSTSLALRKKCKSIRKYQYTLTRMEKRLTKPNVKKTWSNQNSHLQLVEI